MLPIIFCPEKAQLQDNLNEVKRYLAYPKSAQLDKKTEELIFQTIELSKNISEYDNQKGANNENN